MSAESTDPVTLGGQFEALQFEIGRTFHFEGLPAPGHKSTVRVTAIEHRDYFGQDVTHVTFGPP